MTKITFQSVMDALLKEGKPFPKKYLSFFSDMHPASLEHLLDDWPRISLTSKRILLDELTALLDEDTTVCFDDFARALLADPDAPVRARAMRLLAECDDEKLIPAYEKILASDPNPEVRAAAADAFNLFVELGELEGIPEAAHRRVEDALLAASRDDSAEVRRRALESLGYSSREEVHPLIEAAIARTDPDWQASALIAMGRSSDDERWSEPIVRMMLSEEEDVRLEAVKAAGELALPAARLPLLNILDEEEDASVLSAVIWSLSQVGGEDVRVYLQNLLDKTENDDAIAFIEDALDNLSFTEGNDRFDFLAVDPDEDLVELDELEEDEDEEEKPASKKAAKSGKKKLST